jgi:hypothetical protein
MSTIHLKYILKSCQHFSRCSVCETLFNSAMELEHHKEALEHWSDEDEVKCCLFFRKAFENALEHWSDEDEVKCCLFFIRKAFENAVK